VPGESVLGGEPVGASGLRDDLGGGQVRHPGQGQQRRRQLTDPDTDLPLQGADIGAQRADPGGQAGSDRRDQAVHPSQPRRDRADVLPAPQRPRLRIPGRVQLVQVLAHLIHRHHRMGPLVRIDPQHHHAHCRLRSKGDQDRLAGTPQWGDATLLSSQAGRSTTPTGGKGMQATKAGSLRANPSGTASLTLS
jgi:hypothetical protein